MHLTPIEYRLLACWSANAGRVLTAPQLLREVWGPSHQEHATTCASTWGICGKSWKQDPAQPDYLLTETGVGYRLLLPDSADVSRLATKGEAD